jgi:hypothetical protein
LIQRLHRFLFRGFLALCGRWPNPAAFFQAWAGQEEVSYATFRGWNRQLPAEIESGSVGEGHRPKGGPTRECPGRP